MRVDAGRSAAGDGVLGEVRCLVWDVDDTLYLERDYVRSGLAAVGDWAGRTHALAGFFDAAWEAFRAGTRGSIFNEALRRLRVEPDEALLREMVDVYRAHPPRIELLPDARACLQRLHGHLPMACITGGPAASQRAKAEALGLARWLDPIVLTAELGSGLEKPHPRAFETIQQATGQAGADCVYVADNPAKDFTAPAALGWKTVRVRRRGGLHYDAASGPDVLLELDNLAGLPDLLSPRPP